MNQAGAVNSDWDTDWNAIRPHIQNYLAANPHKRTLFVLDATTGITRGVAPVLYTFGDSDVPAMPVARATAPYTAYVMYRARQGIQTTSPYAVHVSSLYDAELGLMSTQTLTQIVGLRTADYPNSNFIDLRFFKVTITTPSRYIGSRKSTRQSPFPFVPAKR
jgi:hypothetical protein